MNNPKSGKVQYAEAIYDLGQYIRTITPEIEALEQQIEEEFSQRGKVRDGLVDYLFTKKANALRKLIADLEGGALITAKEMN